MAHKEENNESRSCEENEPLCKSNDLNIDKELESEPFLTDVDLDTTVCDFHDAYKIGNFGVKRGKIDLILARRWSVTHIFVVLAMCCLSIVVCFIMGNNHDYWIDRGLAKTFTVWIVLCVLAGFIMSYCSLYLVRHLATLRRPLFLLLVVRLLAVLECLLLVFALVTTLFVVANAKADENHWKEDYPTPMRVEIRIRPTTSWSWGTERHHYKYHRVKGVRTTWPKWPSTYTSVTSSPYDDNPRYTKPHHNSTTDSVGTFRVLCVFLVIIMIVDWITAMVWLFHWWRCLGCFECFKSLAIFQPGEPLADGVSDPRNGIISECVYLCWRAYNTDCGTII